MQSQKTVAVQKKEAGRWSKEEHQRFMLGLMQYGKNWKQVEDIVATRSGSQVRSHAQKFFNKIQKSSRSSKGKKDKRFDHGPDDNNQEEVSFTQNNDLIRSLDDENSLATPLQIISLIKKESVDNRMVNLSNFKKSLEQNEQKQNKIFAIDQNKESFLTLKNNNPSLNNESSELPGKLNSFKSMNNIISAYEALNQEDQQNRYEDQSFLIGLTKKYKKYFSKGGQFENLIDFGNPHQVAKAAEIEKSIRKKSWTLAEGIQGDEQDLQDIKKRLKQSRSASIVQKPKKLQNYQQTPHQQSNGKDVEKKLIPQPQNYPNIEQTTEKP